MIRLIDLPGVRELENDQVLCNAVRGDQEEIDTKAHAVSRALFGISQHGAAPREPDVNEEDDPEAWARYDADVERFEAVDDLSYEQMGWDVNDDLGRELLVLRQFSRQIAAAYLGIAGKTPDVQAAGVQTWAAKMEAEASRFRPTRRKP